jgi:hypothetical protein
MSTGFGIGRVDPRTTNNQISDTQLKAAAGDHTALLKLIEQHLRRLQDKYAENPVFQPQQVFIQGASEAASLKIDLTTTPHNSLLLCVTAGTLNLWVGDYGGIGQSANPNAGQYVAITNQQLFFPLQGRVYTVVNPSTSVDLVACLTPIAL